MPTRRMRILAEELNSLISTLEARIDNENETESDESWGAMPAPSLADWREAANDIYKLRRTREKVFGSLNFFGEPCWDILLDLFIAELDNRTMQTTSVCIAAQVPQTTALRWISVLEREGLVYRYKDRSDTRRINIRLTELGLRNMALIFFDRCYISMGKKAFRPPRLSTLQPDSATYEESRSQILKALLDDIELKRVSAGR